MGMTCTTGGTGSVAGGLMFCGARGPGSCVWIFSGQVSALPSRSHPFAWTLLPAPLEPAPATRGFPLDSTATLQIVLSNTLRIARGRRVQIAYRDQLGF